MKTKIVASTEKFDHFWETYVNIARFPLLAVADDTNDNRKVFVGEKKNRVCRFCLKGEKETTFKKLAHVIPEFMGNKVLFSYFECDRCNDLFSKYETAFFNFDGLIQTFSRIKGKNGVPIFKDYKNDGLEIVGEGNNLKLLIHDAIDSSDMSREEKLTAYTSFKIDEVAGMINFNLTKPSYVPRHALKCLMKIAFCFMPPWDVKQCDTLRRWLINDIDETNFPSHPFFTVYREFQTINFRKPVAMLFARRGREKNEWQELPVPYNTMLLMFGHLSYQIFLPFCDRDHWLWNEPEVYLMLEEHMTKVKEGGLQAEGGLYDLSSCEKRVGEAHKFSVGWEPMTN